MKFWNGLKVGAVALGFWLGVSFLLGLLVKLLVICFSFGWGLL